PTTPCQPILIQFISHLRRDTDPIWWRVFGAASDWARFSAGYFHTHDLPTHFHAVKTPHATLHTARRVSGGNANIDRVGRRRWFSEFAGRFVVRGFVSLAIPPFSCDCADVPGRLCARRLSDVARI